MRARLTPREFQTLIFKETLGALLEIVEAILGIVGALLEIIGALFLKHY